jgi:hypothetical protein
MPTTSYFDNIEPMIGLKTLPQYRLPSQSIMQNLNARTQYFLEGAQKVKNMYDASEKFGLSLVHDTHKEEFKKLMQELTMIMKPEEDTKVLIAEVKELIRHLRSEYFGKINQHRHNQQFGQKRFPRISLDFQGCAHRNHQKDNNKKIIAF